MKGPNASSSGMVIQKLGHTPVMAIALASLALRCSLYYLVVNPWWFLPIELLNGLSYGLFHTVMASYASHIAPPGAQATLQAIVRACFSSGESGRESVGAREGVGGWWGSGLGIDGRSGERMDGDR